MDRKFTQALASGLLVSALLLFGFQHFSADDKAIKTLGSKDGFVEISKSELKQLQSNRQEWQDKYETLLAEQEALEKQDQKENSPEKESIKKPVTYHLVIKKGTTSKDISRILAEEGIIDDADDFDTYLGERQLQGYMQIGEYEVNSDMKFSEISAIITKNAKSR